MEDVEQLKQKAIAGAAAECRERDMKVKLEKAEQKLNAAIPTMEEQKKTAEERYQLLSEKLQLEVQVEYLEKDLEQEHQRGHSMDGMEM